jgi:hypothetical protein
MPPDSAFAPYRLAAGVLPEEGWRSAGQVGAGPLVAPPGQPLAPTLLRDALAWLETGRAATGAEACRAAGGDLSGNREAPLACLVGDRHRLQVGESARAALAAGYAGLVLHQPDAPLVEGLLGAGFCPDCQREFQRRLSRKFGEQFQPIDFLATARDAVAGASGAVTFATLPFGRDFWRFRHEALERAVRAYVRATRDAARAAGRAFSMCGWFGALGPSQLGAARHLDSAVFPVPLAGVSFPGRFELLRGALPRRSVAVELPADAPPAAWLRLASLGAPFGIGLAGVQPGGEAGAVLAGIRTLMHEVAARGASPSVTTPLVECAVLYSAEADLWSSGRHRRAVEAAIEELASQQLQVTLVLRPAEAPIGTPLVVAGAETLSRPELREVEKRRAAGGVLIRFDGPGAESGLAHDIDATFPLLGRAVAFTEPAAVLATVRARGEAVDVHLATAWPERAHRLTLRLPALATRGARKARLRMSDGSEARVRLTRSGDSALADLPTFTGYAVLSPET